MPEPGNPQALNRYSYALGNPVKYTDPTGHAVKPPRRFTISIDISGWNPKVVQALDVLQETARTVAELPPIMAPFFSARSFVKNVRVDSEAGTLTLGNRAPVSANEVLATFAGMPATIAAPSALALVDGMDDVTDDALYARSSFRKSTIEEAVDAAPRNSSGEMICPTCGEVIPETIEMQTKNGPVTRRGFDLDHYPMTWAERVEQWKQSLVRLTRQEVLDVYNTDVRVQCPLCNQGHNFEGIAGEFE